MDTLGIVTVTIDGYLIQEKLQRALTAIVGEAAWRGKERLVASGRQLRWDMVYETSTGMVAVEFDGDEHYRHSLKVKGDREKDAFAKLNGYRVIRMPYWVQLTTETLQHYFDLDATIVQNFPHGFVTTRIFPASYCELGINRFKTEIRALPVSVRQAVIASLRERAAEFGKEYVVPSALEGVLLCEE
jgi:hypothetical protein